MSEINYQALREVAEAAKGDTTWQNLQAFHAAATPEVVQALLPDGFGRLMSQEAKRQLTDSEPEYLQPGNRYFPLVPLYWKKHLKTLNPLLLIAISHIRRSSNAKSDAPDKYTGSIVS